MKNKEKLFILILLFLGINGFAQSIFYNVNGKEEVSEQAYREIIDSLSRRGKVESLSLKTISKKDSIVNYVFVQNAITTPDGFDPFGKTKEFIGERFPIQNFKDENEQSLNDDFLEGKPTFINFWFTSCPPCVKELPILSELQRKYNNQVHFIAITFENMEKINQFLEKYEFDFEHIANSKSQIDNLNISAYPTSLILDKNGIIKKVSGEISEYSVKDIEYILKTLM